jgi:hypothetical protein
MCGIGIIIQIHQRYNVRISKLYHEKKSLHARKLQSYLVNIYLTFCKSNHSKKLWWGKKKCFVDLGYLVNVDGVPVIPDKPSKPFLESGPSTSQK